MFYPFKYLKLYYISMQFVDEVSTTGSLKTYRVKESITIADILAELGLKSKFFAILVDGKKVDIDFNVSADSEITILPKIAGGK